MSIFFDLFSPGNRHRTEELRRLENTREDEGRGEPGRGPIDLTSGKVVIRAAVRPAGVGELGEEADAERTAHTDPAPAAGDGDAGASEDERGTGDGFA